MIILGGGLIMIEGLPTFTIVIPTKNRPELLKRAIESCLKQTYTNYEVLVVIDGEDPETEMEMQTYSEKYEQIRFIKNKRSLGGSGARNIGVKNAKGIYIAFLDDDDEFYPNKLDEQYKQIKENKSKYFVGYCKVKAKSPKKVYEWPRRELRKNEHISEYLLSRNSLFQGEGLIQTTMLVISKELLLKYPFNENMIKHQEWDWLINVWNSNEDINFAYCDKVLAIWYIEENRESISTKGNWQFSYKWSTELLKEKKITQRAYASFLLTFVSAIASKEKEYSLITFLLQNAIKNGKVKLIDIVINAGIWILKPNTRRTLRKLFSKGN